MDSLTSKSGLFEIQSTSNPFLHIDQTLSFLQIFKPSSTTDSFAAFILFVASLGILTHGRYWNKPDPFYHVYYERPQVTKAESSSNVGATRDISQRLRAGGYHCVIFWGSQSGTAERFAEDLGRESAARFGINALVADLSDYDASSIANIQETHFAIFLLSTYEEGDPSDNAMDLWDWIKYVSDGSNTLGDLRYLAFGLGNSNYKYYNRVLDVVASALDAAGAKALIPHERADDANGGTEEDFQSWKDAVFILFQRMGYQQKSISYQPNIKIDFNAESSDFPDLAASPTNQQSGTNSAIVPLVIKTARELFIGGHRNCVHMELDLTNSGLSYKTGDHIGIWPCNPDEEVERLIGVLGLQQSRHKCFNLLESAKPKIPSPTTPAVAFRHHLEICGSVARRTVLDVAQFAPTPEAKALLLELGQDRKAYEELTAVTHITFARLLQLASPTHQWTALPLSFVIESLLPLQPRYYSISSSPVMSPRRIAITALVVDKALPGQAATIIHGLTSNYLLSVSNLASATGLPRPSYGRTDHVAGHLGPRILAHVRKSKFKLPVTSSTPIILICAGTGFAPFRGFLQERAKLHAMGKPVGTILLFVGCRNQNDFIYHEEISRIQTQLGNSFKVFTAFSRDDCEQRLYVQDRVGEQTSQILAMLEAGANLYVCGKASMAREVDVKIEEAAQEAKQWNEAQSKAWADALKRRGKWKVDVWG